MSPDEENENVSQKFLDLLQQSSLVDSNQVKATATENKRRDNNPTLEDDIEALGLGIEDYLKGHRTLELRRSDLLDDDTLPSLRSKLPAEIEVQRLVGDSEVAISGKWKTEVIKPSEAQIKRREKILKESPDIETDPNWSPTSDMVVSAPAGEYKPLKEVKYIFTKKSEQ